MLAGLLLSAAAILVSLVVMGRNLLANPLRAGVGRYDLSTPQASLRAEAAMWANNDVRAILEVGVLLNGPRLREKLRTLKVHKEVPWKEGPVLFVSYEERGVKKYETETLEKDPDTGFWQRRLNVFTMVGGPAADREQEALEKQKHLWRTQGRLE
jgi:hypothetical protein